MPRQHRRSLSRLRLIGPPMARKRDKTATLAAVRRQIDRLHAQLLRQLNRRAVLALKIGCIKKQRKWPVFDARRETFVLRHVAQANRGPLSAAAVQHVFQAVLNECRGRQRGRRRR